MASSLPVSLQLGSAPASSAPVPSPPLELHLLPFHIQYSGPASVRAYFDPQEVTGSYTGEDGAFKAYFRGRALLGTKIGLPAGYVGQVWKSNGPSISRVAVEERRKRERVAVEASESTVYSQDSLRRSPRKHAEPPAKKQKLDDAAAKKKKKKKLVQRAMFDLDDGDAEGDAKEPVNLDQVAVTGLSEPVKLEDTSMLEAVADTESKGADATDPIEIAKVEASEALPTVAAAEAASTAVTSPVKLESSPVRASTPPPSSSALQSSIPATPSTPAASSSLPVINIATPKPFSRAMEDEVEMAEAITERILEPVATFESVTIWNPDTALDRGEDVYVRAMDEWTRLAEFIHA